MDFSGLSLIEAAERIERREISPVELTQSMLERIERLNPRLNCYLTVTAEDALRCAREAEEQINKGEYQGPLHGIPIGLKDLFETSGVRTTAGSKFFADYIPEKDAAVVEKLRAAGAIVLGKLNMHEIALGVTNVNPHYGPSRNPWNPKTISGGSSGGSGGALAAGLCFGALGSDTGGSIRIPSSLCGITGLKPTYGRVSLRGVIPLSWSLDHAGPMARGVDDVALLLKTIAGYDPEDPASQDLPVPDFLGSLKAGIKGWRVALASDEFFTKADSEVLEAVKKAAGVLESLGARVEEVPFPEARLAAQNNGLLVTAEAAAFHQERLQKHPEDFGADVLQRLQGGAAYSGSEVSQARRMQSILRRKFEQFFAGYDLLLTPTTPSAALLIEAVQSGQNADAGQTNPAVEAARQLTRFTAPFNFTGLPALSIPCGFTASGLPTGLQLAARPWGEASLLRAGYAYQQATDWHRKAPALE